MKAKTLKAETEYEAALAYVETLMDAEPGSPKEDELELFALLIEQYEEEHYPIAPPIRSTPSSSAWSIRA